MVAALYSSKMTRTKLFTRNEVQFGWETIEDMYIRDTQRAREGLPRRVPGMQESYVYRDIWSRLNVKPAKIMQVYVFNSEYLLPNLICSCHFTIDDCVCSFYTKSFCLKFSNSMYWEH